MLGQQEIQDRAPAVEMLLLEYLRLLLAALGSLDIKALGPHGVAAVAAALA